LKKGNPFYLLNLFYTLMRSSCSGWGMGSWTWALGGHTWLDLKGNGFVDFW